MQEKLNMPSGHYYMHCSWSDRLNHLIKKDYTEVRPPKRGDSNQLLSFNIDEYGVRSLSGLKYLWKIYFNSNVTVQPLVQLR